MAEVLLLSAVTATVACARTNLLDGDLPPGLGDGAEGGGASGGDGTAGTTGMAPFGTGATGADPTMGGTGTVPGSPGAPLPPGAAPGSTPGSPGWPGAPVPPFGGGGSSAPGTPWPVPTDPNGAMCTSDGWCCYSDGTCCNDLQGICTGPGTPIPGPFPFPFPFPFPGGPTPVPTTTEPWNPPFALGDPGWQNSDEPLCTGELGWVASHAVWADSRGVFVLADGAQYGGMFGLPGGFPVGVDCTQVECPVQVIFKNDGSGWEPFFERGSDSYFFPGPSQLTGIENGPLFVYGYGEERTGPCGLATIGTDGTRRCEPVYGVEHVYVVNENLAYGVLEGSLVSYDGARWGPLPTLVQTASDMARVWATPSQLFATGYSPGKIYRLSGGDLTIEDTRTLARFSAIWGFSETDVWAGTENGSLFHYDGTSWNELALPSTSCPYASPILGIWGANGVVYFYTPNRIGRVRNGQVETLADWQCDDPSLPVTFTSLWGRNENEVFVALLDQRTPQQECGTTFLLYYDGSAFHRF